MKITFEWNNDKDQTNQQKHSEAQNAFLDPNRVIAEDLEHSHSEKRYYWRRLLAKGQKNI